MRAKTIKFKHESELFTWPNESKKIKIKKSHKVVLRGAESLHPCGAEETELFVLANCPSNKHNYHQNSCGVPMAPEGTRPHSN